MSRSPRQLRSTLKRKAEEALAQPPAPLTKRSRIHSPDELWQRGDDPHFVLNVKIFNMFIQDLELELLGQRQCLRRPVVLRWTDLTSFFVVRRPAYDLVPLEDWQYHICTPEFKHEVLQVLDRSGYDAFIYKEKDEEGVRRDCLSVGPALPLV
jgi:hypothetical protein